MFKITLEYKVNMIWKNRDHVSLCTFLCHMAWLSNYRYQFELNVIGYLEFDTHMICTPIMQALMAFIAMFSTVFKIDELLLQRD